MSTSVAPRSLPYAILDVFAERALEGNSLAVFPDANGLGAAEMQALARETNLSETTFIVPRSPEIERAEGVEVRIFTTAEELPFAGHPTLGTAAWLHLHHPRLAGAETIELRLPAGRIPVRFEPSGAGEPGVFGTMRQKDPSFGQVHDRFDVAAALGLAPDDLDPELRCQTVSTGLPFLIVPLRTLEVSARLQIPARDSANFLAGTDAKFFYCITPAAPGSGADWHARMQFYNGEDPATGSASGCAVAWLVRHGLGRSEQPLVIEQGVEMRRPSRIHVRARRLADGSVSDVFVGGRTVPVASGLFFLP